MKSSKKIQKDSLYKKKDFCIEENPTKNFIQRTLYRSSNVKGNALIVSGPAVERHLNDYKDLIAPTNPGARLVIAETDKFMLNKILTLWGDLYKNYSFKTIIYYGNIVDYPLNGIRFIDADLTATFTTCLPIFKKLYNNLKDKCLNKSLICTYSSARREKNESIPVNISKIIGELPNLVGGPIKLDPIIKKGGNDFIHMFQYKCRDKDILAFEYRQNSGIIMISFIINW